MCPGFRLIETQKTTLLIFSFLKVRGDPGQLTLLLTRGAGSGVLGDVDSFGVSEVELRDELLLESSLFCLLFPNGRREDTKSDASFCSSLCKSCFSLYARSLAITWDKGIPNACGINSARKKKNRYLHSGKTQTEEDAHSYHIHKSRHSQIIDSLISILRWFCLVEQNVPVTISIKKVSRHKYTF